MRVIAGEFRSRRLRSIPGVATRPTPDRLRETLFDIIGPRVEGSVFLDAYAGTGAVGIEALSRGASHAYFLERNRAAYLAIRENISSLGLDARATIVPGSAASHLTRYAAGIVFLDPPYELEREYASALAALGDAPPLLTIAQHSARLTLEDGYGKLRRSRLVRQGDNALSFYVEQSI
jgi:16S rRNA (guanine(966)-N(2))-methyltransferase RsmD